MSDSKYLPYQKPFSELETECNPLAEPASEVPPACPPCPAECTPNPDAIVPDWTKRRLNEAFLNEKTCQYWITSKVAWDDGNPTYYTSTGADELENRMQQYIEPAVTSFLMNNGKPYDSSTVALVTASAAAEDYHLSERSGIKMRVLVTLPYDILNNIPDAETSTVVSGEKTVDIDLPSFKNTHRKVAHILSLYSRYQGLWSRTDGAKILFEDNKPLNLQDEHDYFKDFRSVFLDFVQEQGFVPKEGMFKPGLDQAETVTLDFTEEMELKAVTIIKNKYCDPIVFDGGKISSLKQTFPFNNPTTMGYVSNINLMADDLAARGGPKPWLEFVEEHTYPTVLVDYGTGGELEETLLSCAVDNLNIGDIFGDLFENLISLPDALAFLYDQSLCMTPEQRAEILANLNDASLLEQLQDEALFNEFFDNADFFGKLPDIMKEVTNIKEFFTEIFDNLKLCGLFNLLSSALECLSIGFDLEELMEQACSAAINSMDTTSFEKLWLGLPAADREAITAEIAAQLGEEIIAPWDTVEQTKSLISQLETIVLEEDPVIVEAILNALSTMDVDYLDTTSMQSALDSFGGIQAALDALPEGSSTTQLDSALSTSDMTGNSYTDNVTIPSASEVNEIIDRIREALATIPPASSSEQSEDNGFGSSSAASGTSNFGIAPCIGVLGAAGEATEIVLEVYVSALLSYYSEKGFENVLDALNNLPGAQVIANIIALIECPAPPLFDPSIMDSIKSLDLDFCEMTLSITLPDMRSPLAWLPNLKDYFKYVIIIAKYTVEQILLAALKALIIKILELLYGALCKLLAATTDIAAALMSGEQISLYDMIRESFCGADATDEEVEDTLNGLMASLGVTDSDAAGELSSTDGLNSLVSDISAVLTEEEMADLILGNPTPDSLSLVQEIIEIENPAYKSSFANKAQIASVFRNVGSLLPRNFKSDLRERVRPRLKPKPSSPTICSSTQDLENWRNARASLLRHNADISGDTVTDEQIEEQWNKLRDRIKEDFNTVSNILQKGPGQFLQDALPPIMPSGGAKDPDCPDCPDPQEAGTALLPREPEELNQVLTSATNTLFGGIEAAFVSDLLGRKGFANMLLSDTLAMPYTRHNSRVGSIFSPTYVHTEDQEHEGFLGVYQAFMKLPVNAGAGLDPLGMWPTGVASHLRNELVNLRDASFETNIEYIDNFETIATLLGLTVDQLLAMGTIPSKEPDLVLEFRDNNQDGTGPGETYTYGFDINFEYFTYTYEGDTPVVNTDDISQLRIIDRYQTTLFDQVLDSSESTMSFTSKSTLSSAASSEKSKYDLSGAPLSPQIECFGQILMESLRQSECDDAAVESIGVEFGSSIEFWDNIMNRALASFAESIADGDILWNHGWSDSKITNNDLIYLEPDAAVGDSAKDKIYGSSLSGLSGTQYLEAVKAKKDIGPLGTSALVDDDGDITEIPHPRVTFLDPQIYGGNYMRAPYYVSPPAATGWTGILQALVPEICGCDPQPQKLITFDDITARVSEVFDNLADDPRLSQDQECIKELPYARILDRTAASNLEGVISALIRIYVSEEFMKAMPIFGKFSLPTAGSIFADYITAKMSEDIKNNTIRLGLFRDQKYWYAMLEQAVQIYGRRVDAGELEATGATQQALDALNNFQINFEVNFPSENDLKAAQDADEEIFGDKINIFTNLKEYRQLKVLQGVQQTEVDATTIFSALVQEQLEFMADSAKETLSPIGINPSIDNLKKYFLGSSGMCLGSDIEIDLPEDQRTVATPTIMDVGELLGTTNVDTGATAYVLASPLGQLGTIDPKDLDAGFFFLEKYVVIEDIAEANPNMVLAHGTIPEEIFDRSELTRGVTSLSDWQEFLDLLITDPNINTLVPLSEYFGNLSLNDSDELEGSVGVRYGLRLSYALPESLSEKVKAADPNLNFSNINTIRDRTYSPAASTIDTQDPMDPQYGQKYVLADDANPNPEVTLGPDLLLIPLVSTEIDALDMAIDDYGFNAAADSYDVNCMAELLAKEPRLELLLEYVFPLEKLQGLLAVYTARGFVPSIGENDNWESYEDRKDVGNLPFSAKFDKWDQSKTFSKSKEQCRRLFKAMWKSREFSFTDEDSHDVQTNFSENMRDFFGLLPDLDVSWFMRRRSRSNPFDKDGNEC